MKVLLILSLFLTNIILADPQIYKGINYHNKSYDKISKDMKLSPKEAWKLLVEISKNRNDILVMDLSIHPWIIDNKYFFPLKESMLTYSDEFAEWGVYLDPSNKSLRMVKTPNKIKITSTQVRIKEELMKNIVDLEISHYSDFTIHTILLEDQISKILKWDITKGLSLTSADAKKLADRGIKENHVLRSFEFSELSLIRVGHLDTWYYKLKYNKLGNNEIASVAYIFILADKSIILPILRKQEK